MKYRTEPFDLWQYLCTSVYEPLIRCRIDFDGFINEDVLTQAVTASRKTIPLIGCGFTAGQKYGWTDKRFTGEDIVSVVKAESDKELIILKCLSADIDFAEGPQLKIFIVKKSDGDTVCVVISHLICDAAGFKQYLYLLSKLYTQLINHKTELAPDFLPRGLEPLFKGLSFGERLKILSSNFQVYKIDNEPDQQGIDFKEGASITAIERLTLTEDVFKKLKGFTKENNATINDGLMTLFARSFCKNTGSEKVMFPATMDLRKFIPDGQEYGITNYSSNCMCRFSVKPHDALTDTLAQASKQMSVYKSSKDVLKPFIQLNQVSGLPLFLVKQVLHQSVMQSAITFTNLGIIDINALNFDNTKIKDVYLTASIKPRPYLQLTASTYNGRCTLGCNIYGSEKDKMFVIGLLNDIRTEAEKLLKPDARQSHNKT